MEVWEAAATLCFLPLLCLASWAASRLDRRNKVSTILYCTILYCTVLYCTVLYCTAQGDRSSKQLEIEVEDKQEVGDFSSSYFKGRKNLMSNIFLIIKYFYKLFLLFKTIRPKQNLIQREG